MIRIVAAILVAHVLVGCGSVVPGEDEASAGGNEAAASNDKAAAGDDKPPQCANFVPPSGACSAGEECRLNDAGCISDSYCKDGTWASVSSCNAVCPQEGLTPGASCDDEGDECLYIEGGACVSNLKCTGGVWTESEPPC